MFPKPVEKSAPPRLSVNQRHLLCRSDHIQTEMINSAGDIKLLGSLKGQKQELAGDGNTQDIKVSGEWIYYLFALLIFAYLFIQRDAISGKGSTNSLDLLLTAQQPHSVACYPHMTLTVKCIFIHLCIYHSTMNAQPSPRV